MTVFLQIWCMHVCLILNEIVQVYEKLYGEENVANTRINKKTKVVHFMQVNLHVRALDMCVCDFLLAALQH